MRLSDDEWGLIQDAVTALARADKFDISELRKALSYLNAHVDDLGRFLKYLTVQAKHAPELARSVQTRRHREALLAALTPACKSISEGHRLAVVLGHVARRLHYEQRR